MALRYRRYRLRMDRTCREATDLEGRRPRRKRRLKGQQVRRRIARHVQSTLMEHPSPDAKSTLSDGELCRLASNYVMKNATERGS